MGGGAGGPGGPGGPPMPPQLPKSPVGGPGGPGGTPMLSPGGGAGNQAAALTQIAECVERLKLAMMAWSGTSDEFQKIARAISSLNTMVKGKHVDLQPAGKRQDAAMGAPGNPLAGAPPPGIASAPLPPPGAPGAAAGGY
jgi:hypothetical protein